jgi:hypothetical protein
MPVLYKEYNISKDPEQHGIGGSSSGAIAAFTVAWERPNEFRKVLSNVGSFVDLRGGYVYPERVLASEKKPIRVFLCDGRNDHRGLGPDGAYDEKRDWFFQNVRLMKALTQKRYDVNYTWGMNLHGQKFGGAIMPDMMRWLWRDGPVSTDPKDMVERAFRQPAAKRKYGRLTRMRALSCLLPPDHMVHAGPWLAVTPGWVGRHTGEGIRTVVTLPNNRLRICRLARDRTGRHAGMHVGRDRIACVPRR